LFKKLSTHTFLIYEEYKIIIGKGYEHNINVIVIQAFNYYTTEYISQQAQFDIVEQFNTIMLNKAISTLSFCHERLFPFENFFIIWRGNNVKMSFKIKFSKDIN